MWFWSILNHPIWSTHYVSETHQGIIHWRYLCTQCNSKPELKMIQHIKLIFRTDFENLDRWADNKSLNIAIFGLQNLLHYKIIFRIVVDKFTQWLSDSERRYQWNKTNIPQYIFWVFSWTLLHLLIVPTQQNSGKISFGKMSFGLRGNILQGNVIRGNVLRGKLPETMILITLHT